MVILLLGDANDPHLQAVNTYCQSEHHDCLVLDSRWFPSRAQMTLYPGRINALDENTLSVPHPDGPQSIPWSSITAVYWRTYLGCQLPPELPRELEELVHREHEATVGSLFRMLPNVRWINGVHAIEQHRYKPFQLHLMTQHGLPVPDTCITNHPDHVKAFYNRHQGQVIFKPVAGGVHTALMQAEDLTDERLAELQKTPVQFQQYLPGPDIRVYVLNQQIYAGQIDAQTIDFRSDPQATISPIELSEIEQAQCLTLARCLGYVWTGLDAKRDSEGRLIFLEGNPSPMFLGFEKATGYPLTEALSQALMVKPNLLP